MAYSSENQQPLGTTRGIRSLPTTPFRPAPISSASNYVNQNVFPSISSFYTSHPLNPDSFPNQFHSLHPNNENNENKNAYIQHYQQQQQQHHHFSTQNQVPPHSVRATLSPLPLPSHPLHYHSHFPDPQSSHPLAPNLAPNHFVNPRSSPVPFVPVSSKPLPTVSHIPLLSGRTDFGAWNDGVRTLLLHLGCLGHIADPPAPGLIPLPDRVPTYPPPLYVSPSHFDFSNYKMWWEQDNIASHVLLSRLSPTVRSLLPFDDSDPNQPRTSRIIYDILRESYSLRGYASGSALYSDLRALSCGSRIQEYVTKWRSGVSQLRSARYPLIVREMIELFLDRLPTSVPFQILRHKIMERIDYIRDDDITEFIRITNEVLDIDNLYRRSNPTRTMTNSTTRPSPSAPRPSPTVPNGTSTTSTVPALVSNSRPRLICANSICGATGHTIDTCFKVGGGLEGQRDQYLAKRKGAQAHLAQIDEVIASRDRAQAFLLHLDDILQEDDGLPDITSPPPITTDPLPDPVPTFSALSLTTTDSIVTPVSVINDDFFELYLPSSLESLAYSAISPSFIDFSMSPFAFSSTSFPFNSLLDSGCTHHIIRDRSLFWTYDTSRATSVKTANCGSLQSLARGSVRFRVTSGGRTVNFILNDCLHAPDAPVNLFSVGALTEKDVVFTFQKDVTTISFPANHPVLPSFSFDATVLHRLSFLDCDFIFPPNSPTIPLCDPPSPLLDLSDTALTATFPPVSLTPDLWHRRFGHLGFEATRAVLTKNYATGLNHIGSFQRSHCISCLIGKSPQQPYNHHGNRAANPGDLLHMDTCGPFPTLTPQKHSSFLASLDDHSQFGFTDLHQRRDQSYDSYRRNEATIELVTGNRIRTVRCDGAPELCQGRLGSHLRDRGIAIQTTAPYAHQQNGRIERYIRTLVDGMQTLLADSGLPFSFWGDALSTTRYLRNRLPSSVLPTDITPYESFHRSKPDLSHLRVWGCQCFVTIAPELRTKGGPRRYEAIFVGYEENRLGWRVRDLKGAYHFSRDVIFNESVPGRLPGRLSSHSSSTIPPSSPSSTISPPGRATRTRTRTPAGQAFTDAIKARDLALAVRRSKQPDQGGAPISLHAIVDFASLLAYDSWPDSIPTWSLDTEVSLLFTAYGFLSHSPSNYLRAPRTYDLMKPPDSYHEACARPDTSVWHAAMEREMDSLRSRNAFEPCILPSGRKPIGVRWVYAYKYNPDGTIIRGKEKARLVAQGFSQRPEDFDETYAPVAKMTSIRIILAFAAVNNLEIMASDVKTAFLHCRLRSDIYCRPIPGQTPLSAPNTVLCILVALYGLRQSAYEFYMLLVRSFNALGLQRCDVDHAVFYGTWTVPPDPSIPPLPGNAPLYAIIPVHVDDGLIVCNSIPLYSWIISQLQKTIEIIDMGPASLYLGIRITRDRTRRKLWLSQKSYCVELLRVWNMSNCTTTNTPMVVKPYLLPPSQTSLPDIKDDDIKPLFQKLVGSLIYLAVSTRPDISYAAMALGQFNANPTRGHLIAGKRVLRYIAGTLDLSLEFNFDGGVVPATIGGFIRNCAVSDADWASDESDRKSISGYCFYFFNSLVSWSAVKQKTISLSSTEAEYYSMTHALKEALWIRLFLSLLSFPIPRPFPLLSDNQSACAIANTSSITSRSKHIDVRHHFIRDHITDGTFCTNWVPTSDMPADIFTKPLPFPIFTKHRTSLGLVTV
jgi:hypothetical protein